MLTDVTSPSWTRAGISGGLDDHEAFAASRRRTYLPRPEIIAPLDDAVAPGSGARALVVTGASGAGKSSLLAHWSTELARSEPELFIITHYVGAAAASDDHLTIIRRVITAIRDRYGLPRPVPSDPAELEEQFPLWLAEVRDERVVIIIDALNQLALHSQSLEWLPAYLHPNTRLIVSTTEGPLLDRLGGRGWPELWVTPLSAEQRAGVVRLFLADHRVAASSAQLERFAAAEQTANPLFLRTTLREVQSHGLLDRLDARVDYYLGARDLDELFERVLARLEGEIGRPLVRDALLLLWASRTGLTESDLRELTGASHSKLRGLRSALDSHLIDRGGALSFYHDYMRSAVVKRYSAARVASRLHARLAALLASRPDDESATRERLWHLAQSGDQAALKQALVDLHVVELLMRDDTRYDLVEFWRSLRDRFDMAEEYRAAIERFESDGGSERELGPILNHVAQLLARSGLLAESVTYQRRAMELLVASQGEGSPASIDAMINLASVLRECGDMTEPRQLAERALAAAEQHMGPNSRETADVLHVLGESLADQKRSLEAAALLRRSLAVSRAAYGRAHPATARVLNDLGLVLRGTGHLAQAEAHYREALAIHEKTCGPDHPSTAETLNNLAQIMHQRGELAESEQLFLRKTAIQERVLGPEHPHTLVGYSNLAMLYRLQGRYDECERLNIMALERRTRVLGRDHPDTLHSVGNLGSLYRVLGRFDEALPLYRRVLETRERIFGPGHAETARARNNLGYCYEALDELDRADELYASALALRRSILGEDHPLTAQTIRNISMLRLKQGRLEEAEALARRALAVRLDRYGETNLDVAESRAEIGMIVSARGRGIEGEAWARQAIASCAAMAQSDPLQDFDNHLALACALGAQGRSAEAAEAARTADRFVAHLLDPGNPRRRSIACLLERLTPRVRRPP